LRLLAILAQTAPRYKHLDITRAKWSK